MGSPSGSGVNTPSSRDCAYRRGPIPNASCRTGGGHGVRVRFCLGGSEVGSGISTARGADSSPGTARCKLVWCTEPYKGTILYVEFSSSHTRAGLDSIDFRTISVAEAARRGLSKLLPVGRISTFAAEDSMSHNDASTRCDDTFVGALSPVMTRRPRRSAR